MMSEILLSVCIPVYNQVNIVKECISKVLQSRSDKFEIVVSDDNSVDDIQSMVYSFNDRRVRYYVNEKNVGHDRNIIASFKRARGKYAFLLRSRDSLLPEGIGIIISFLEKNQNISYLTTSAYNENKIPKLVYKDCIYKKGMDAIKVHQKLYIHPSGSVYNLKLLNLEELSSFLESIHGSFKNFTVHSLMRLYLANMGDFATLSNFTWVYVDTSNSKDVAVNKTENKKSVYDAEYQYERFNTEMKWANKCLNEKQKTNQYLFLFSSYLYACTWKNKLIYSDKNLQRHYDFSFKKIDFRKENRKFLVFASGIEKDLKILDCTYYKEKRKIIYENITIGALRYLIGRIKMKIPAKKFLKRIMFGKTLNLRKVI